MINDADLKRYVATVMEQRFLGVTMTEENLQMTVAVLILDCVLKGSVPRDNDWL
jgi:hypothetical protein